MEVIMKLRNKSVISVAFRAFCLVLAFVMLFGLTSCKKAVDPTERFCSVLKNTVNECLESGKTVAEHTPRDFSSKKITLKPVLSEAFTTAIGANAPFDLSFLNDAAIELILAKDGAIAKLVASILLDNSALLTADGVIDTETLVAYASLSPVSKSALKIDIAELLKEEEIELPSVSNTAPELPYEELKAVFTEYFDAILAKVSAVKEGEGSLSAGEMTAETVTLTWSLTEKAFLDMAAELADKLAADDKVKNIFIDSFKGTEENYADFVDEIKEFSSTVKEIAAESSVEGDCFIAVLHVNKDNELLGLQFKVNDPENNFSEYACAELVCIENEGVHEGRVLVSSVEEAPVKITFSGSETKGVASGKIAFAYDGKEVFSIKYSDLDTKKAEDGSLNGSFIIKPGAGLGSIIDVDAMTATMLGMLELKFGIVEQDKSTEVDISLLMNGAVFVGIKTTVENVDDVTVAVPADFETDPYDWIADFDFVKLVETVENSSLPAEIKQLILGLFDFK